MKHDIVGIEGVSFEKIYDKRAKQNLIMPSILKIDQHHKQTDRHDLLQNEEPSPPILQALGLD